ncbi:MAG: CofH family radical SAM protein [Candidatus Melainabacteria bacterium]|nr:CofH family radical SAM protein [Candidatus Melainabacteria bacterium]
MVSVVLEKALLSPSPIAGVVQKIIDGQRLSRDDALTLYKSHDLIALGALGDMARQRKAGAGKESFVYYIHNMHLNPTSFCRETCRFCSYSNPVDRSKAYIWSVEKVLEEAHNGASLGITEIHMVGGLHPSCNVDYYEKILLRIKTELPNIHIKALTAVEIDYLSYLSGVTVIEILKRLQDAGLGSLPGGGAEIFDEGVRARMKVRKTPPERWLEIHGAAHRLGLKSTATMLTGIGETIENKVDHMLSLREQQEKSHGFMCFIPLKCYYEGTNIADEVTEPTGYDILKDVAIAAVLLDNFPHVKAYWIQLGEKLAQVALSFGADDLDGTIGEEKITHAAGTKSPLQNAKDRMEYLIRSAGYIPVERDTLYNIVRIGDLAAQHAMTASFNNKQLLHN